MDNQSKKMCIACSCPCESHKDHTCGQEENKTEKNACEASTGSTGVHAWSVETKAAKNPCSSC